VRPQLSVELDEWILFYDEIFAATTVVVLFILAGQFSQSTVLRLVTIPICMPARLVRVRLATAVGPILSISIVSRAPISG
jgi:hypothetical protein